MRNRIKTVDMIIGKQNKCFIVAEAGSNHNGSLKLAKMLIESARECGCDAVKFQAFKTVNLVTRDADKANYQKGKSSGRNQFEMLKTLEFSADKHRRVVEYARNIGIPIFYSVFDEESADLIERLGIDIFKLGSGELTNIPLIEHIARKNKSLILSTGMATEKEVSDAVEAFENKSAAQLILMNCSTGYPSRMEDANLRRIEYLKKRFNLPCGNSDHSEGVVVSIIAASLGAAIIEKHFTINKGLRGPDHNMSIDPGQMKQLCSTVRIVEKNPVKERDLKDLLRSVNVKISDDTLEKILGKPKRTLSKLELSQRFWARKAIVASRNIMNGELLSSSNLAIKRPENGILPKDYKRIFGRRARLFIKKESPIKWNMVV